MEQEAIARMAQDRVGPREPSVAKHDHVAIPPSGPHLDTGGIATDARHWHVLTPSKLYHCQVVKQ